jgi:hypothetical protein
MVKIVASATVIYGGKDIQVSTNNMVLHSWLYNCDGWIVEVRRVEGDEYSVYDGKRIEHRPTMAQAHGLALRWIVGEE